ncbi:hypothetical protein Halha_1714 [Halobacteroides halobius DSM 5150]|uniref:Glycoside hydrolase family 127 protein n=1 Tax=Halobacteroides halobius (strain ATCC 35273 / DSM 5150 / MD-1) TaxID=748449 RepID=L0K9F8_HALHC|nr:beta-L-arabinofuranosidase domain-containing protein [Halobacteroides halobius]AGB41651.1 hypothetical protein Halha_1714 [Halobacteroides halobius DSM 5150]
MTLKSISVKDVDINGGLLGEKNELVREKVIPYQWQALNDELPNTEPSHAIENFKIAAGEAEGEFKGMVFQDSDVAKWLEAVAYQLATNPDSELEKTADEVIDLIAKAQQPDGYLNTYYIIEAPDKRWQDLEECHELYCAGHMIEAAVAYYQATGKKKLLDVVCRFADHIDQTFGPQEDKLQGYPGHQEIELALVKLYRVTDEERYLNLAKFFIDERGKEPHYFDLEWEERGKTTYWPDFRSLTEDKTYHQSDRPVREQEVAKGHAVRAVYMYSGMADIAAETGDQSLVEACERLWANTTQKQMYITGGIGSSGYGEAFSFDYDLPNDTAYAETCAAIGLMFWAHRMLHLDLDSQYADVMERALYNGVLSGMSQDGEKFFYVNPLEVWPEACEERKDKEHVKPTRQKWFGCACCPPNIARLLASIGEYIYSTDEQAAYIHLYTASVTEFEIDGTSVELDQETDYPWDENITITVNPREEVEFTLALRIPDWCESAELKVNGRTLELDSIIDNGYVEVNRSWSKGDQIELVLAMPVKRVYSNPKLRENVGKVALQRGPIIYCLEEADNGNNLPAISLPQDKELTVEYKDDLLDGVTVIKGQGYKIANSEDKLYSTTDYQKEPIKIKAVPYFAWDNRELGEMLVWLREGN